MVLVGNRLYLIGLSFSTTWQLATPNTHMHFAHVSAQDSAGSPAFTTLCLQQYRMLDALLHLGSGASADASVCLCGDTVVLSDRKPCLSCYTCICCAGLRAKDIDILVVNCSLFNPTPSLSAMIVNHFNMRSDVLSYNLAGVCCNSALAFRRMS